uniref:Uncharacterized protein n=1 Tax=Meloidogyne incognita TaxID=6306 RepID=A0A914LJD2_MELIC
MTYRTTVRILKNTVASTVGPISVTKHYSLLLYIGRIVETNFSKQNRSKGDFEIPPEKRKNFFPRQNPPSSFKTLFSFKMPVQSNQ